jgi:Putative MetA-pathway of phenol degradation
MKNVRGAFVACALLLLSSTALWAAQTLEINDAATEGYGKYLLELNGDHITNGDFNSTKLNTIMTAGTSEHTELSLEVPYLMLSPSTITGLDEQGLGDMRFRFKQQVNENEVGQALAYELYTDLPTGDQKNGLGTRNVVWGGMLIDTQECHDNAFHVNLGYEIPGRSIKQMHFAENFSILYGVAVEHKFTESFRLVGEIKGERRREVSSVTARDIETGIEPAMGYSHPLTVMAGMIYDLTDSWYVDLGWRTGLNNDGGEEEVLAGAAWRF